MTNAPTPEMEECGMACQECADACIGGDPAEVLAACQACMDACQACIDALGSASDANSDEPADAADAGPMKPGTPAFAKAKADAKKAAFGG